MWYNSKGRLIYDPPRPGMSRRVDWWAIVKVDREITRYYRWWIAQNPQAFGLTKINIKQPSWDAHISVLRGEKPEDNLMHLWKKYHNEMVSFRYRGYPRQSGDTTGYDRPDSYFFIEVDCPRIMQIRQEMNRPTNWSLHLTVGRIY